MRTRLIAVVASVAVLVGVPLGVGARASAPGVVLRVSSVDDLVNGDVSSPAALLARPGRDGISLREAITAADHALGRVAIVFAPSLAGRTIRPVMPLPPITHDGISVVGLTTSAEEPTVTLDAGPASSAGTAGFLVVAASDVSITNVRIIDMRQGEGAINIGAVVPAGERLIQDVRLEWNVLDNAGVAAPGAGRAVKGIDIGPYNVGKASQAATVSLSEITVAHNVISNFVGDGVCVCMTGLNGSIAGVVIQGNTFANDSGQGNNGVEVGTNFSGNTIAGTHIVGNTFTDDASGVGILGAVDSGSEGAVSGNTVSGTVVSRNVFNGNQQCVNVDGAGGGPTASGNAVLDTEISNNAIAHCAGFAIDIADGESGASGNRVDGVKIVNDTLAFNADGGITASSVSPAGVANVSVENSIFWENGSDFDVRSPAAPTVTSSLRGVDPRFVSGQDLHLQSGSPAIDAGRSDGAPSVDLENRIRDSRPDIGAYEYGAAPRAELDVLVDELGGTGTVTSTPAGIACESTCEAAFATNASVTLTAKAAAGSRFARWSGLCTGAGSCAIALSGNEVVTAAFSPLSAASSARPKCKKGEKSTGKHPCRSH